MTERKVEALSERERACLGHLEEAKKLGVSFSRYCRDKQISMHQWTWIKRALMRKGVIGKRGRADQPKAGFAPVRIAAPVASAMPVCWMRHPSGWTIECASYPEVAWMSALMSGAAT
jgi:hypothetical protein